MGVQESSGAGCRFFVLAVVLAYIPAIALSNFANKWMNVNEELFTLNFWWFLPVSLICAFSIGGLYAYFRTRRKPLPVASAALRGAITWFVVQLVTEVLDIMITVGRVLLFWGLGWGGPLGPSHIPDNALATFLDKMAFVVLAESWLTKIFLLPGSRTPMLAIVLGLGGLVAAALGGSACAYIFGRAKKS